MDRAEVLRFLASVHADGDASILVTVGAVEGSSMRSVGTIMGVAQDGSFSGSLSGGCIENAVVAEALEALEAGEPRVVRYGAGSPYLDIRLPCGGGLDLYFAPLGNSDFSAQCLASEQAREPFTILTGPEGASHARGWQANSFDPASGIGAFGQWPAVRLQIIGHGAGVEALARLAATMGCEIAVLTPDERIASSLREAGHTCTVLKRSNETGLLQSDLFDAFVFLFHDHDWEIALIERALNLPHFYLGAMGGRKAHAMREQALLARGVKKACIDSIKAPIGVFHSSRDPQTLALSTLAQVIRAFQDKDFEAALG